LLQTPALGIEDGLFGSRTETRFEILRKMMTFWQFCILVYCFGLDPPNLWDMVSLNKHVRYSFPGSKEG
jgi:hypothetical protein